MTKTSCHTGCHGFGIHFSTGFVHGHAPAVVGLETPLTSCPASTLRSAGGSVVALFPNQWHIARQPHDIFVIACLDACHEMLLG
jgi:hypothetical protein